MSAVIDVEDVSKSYRLGLIGGATLREDIQSWWARVRGRPDPSLPIDRQPDSADRSRGGHIWALRNVSFSQGEGEVLGIIGRNGAGKSTLLKILSRITAPTQGQVRIKGRVASLLEVGTGFHPELTGRENVYLSGAILGMTRADTRSRFDEIVDFAGVGDFMDTPVKRYSSGMYVRLGFAVAAHLDPEILLIDEVLAVGDAAFQKRCVGKMSAVARSGRTVLLVSHNLFTIQQLCDRAIMLSDGRVVNDGPARIVVALYLEGGLHNDREVVWPDRETAPGNHRFRLHAIRVVPTTPRADGIQTLDVSTTFEVQVDYWNTEPMARRIISIHLYNSAGVCVLTTANVPSASLAPDPWFNRPLPLGMFRARCEIPGFLLNDGIYSLSLFVNGASVVETVFVARDILSFRVDDSPHMREEYAGPWLGVVRPRLAWSTEQLE